MLPSGDDILRLVAGYLRRSGLKETLDALQKETRNQDLSEAAPSPSLAEIVDEWTDLKQMLAPPVSDEQHTSLSRVDLEAEFAQVPVDLTMQTVSHSRPTQSAALCCCFVGETQIVWGEANKTLHGIELDGSAQWDHTIPDSTTLGGLISVASNGSVIVVGTMSGAILFLDAKTRMPKQPAVVQHKKYVHRLKMAGQFLVSASHDCSVCIWKLTELGEFALVRQLVFKSIPEGIDFIGEAELIVGVRESNVLRRINISSASNEETLINLNVLQDDHVTFSVLDLHVCPALKNLVAIASDRDRVFVYWVQDSRCRLLRTLTGISSDGMSVARVQFSPGGHFLYASSTEGFIGVFNVASSVMLNSLRHHKNAVRDLAMHPTSSTMVSVSFDRTCTVWSP